MARSTAAGPFVIIAGFEVKPGKLEQFLELAEADSRHSVADEPGCRQLTVTVDRERPDRVVLFEVYDDEAAFDAHLETPRLEALCAGIEPLVVSRQIRRLIRVPRLRRCGKPLRVLCAPPLKRDAPARPLRR